jgi:hypothetical protein
MAITQSKGYGGSIFEPDLTLWGESFAGTYGVLGPADWKVTAKTGLDRTLGIAAGTGFGHRVVDVNDAEVQVALDPLASGKRYDLVVAHRDWVGAGGTTTFDVITGTATPEAVFSSESRAHTPGAQDDQPIALVEVIGNGAGGVLGTIEDCRLWHDNGGTFALSEKVLQFADGIGSRINIAGITWSRVITSAGAAAWVRSDPATVPLFDAGAALAGGSVPGNVLLQAGTDVGTTNAQGFGVLTLPRPFPNGLLFAGAWSGNDTEHEVAQVGPIVSSYTKTGFTYRFWVPDVASGTWTTAKNKAHRVNFFAIGW